MKFISLIVMAVTFFTLPSYAEQSSFLCSAEESTGYDYTNGRWLRERFRPDSRYLVKLQNDVWSVYEYEVEYEHESCDQDSDDILRCNVSGDFIMNLDTMKFSVTNTESYVHSTKRNRESVVLILGACVAM